MTTHKRFSRKRKLQLILILTLLSWLVFDTFMYAALAYIDSTRNLFYAPDIPTPEMLNSFAAAHFHPRWGWDIAKERKGPLGNRKGRLYPQQEIYDLKIFGDSFTYGDEVEDNQTFEYLFEQKTGLEFLNFGVGGYATDQALLKYQDNDVKTKYTLLGILDENIGRGMTVWWNFYENGFAGVKPRFERTATGIELVPTPISRRDQLPQLRDPDFIESLKQHDYWQRYYASINAPARLQWPATLTLLRHADFFSHYLGVLLKNRLSPSLGNSLELAKFYHLYKQGSEGIEVLGYAVDQFIETARKRGEQPIVVLFPLRRSVDILAQFGYKPYQTLVDHLHINQYPFIDLGDIFVSEDYGPYYIGGEGHLSPEGNERVTDAIIDYMKVNKTDNQH